MNLLLLNFYFDFDLNNNAIDTIWKDFQKVSENFEKLKDDFYKKEENSDISKT